MNDILQDISAPALVTVFEANLVELFSLFRQWRRAEVHRGEDILWTITDVPTAFFNSIIRAQLSTNEVDNVIEAAIMRGKSRNVPIGWWTGPATRPTDLAVSLLTHGFIHEWDMPGMAINLSALNANMPIPLGRQLIKPESQRRTKSGMTGFGINILWMRHEQSGAHASYERQKTSRPGVRRRNLNRSSVMIKYPPNEAGI